MANRVALRIFYDNEGGELARIEPGPGFAAESALMRADVLKDLMLALAPMYAEARDAAFEWKRMTRGKKPLRG